MWTTKKNPTSSDELQENWKSQIVGRNLRIIAHWWTLCEDCSSPYFNLHLFRILNKFHHLSWTLSVTGVIVTFLCNFIWEATCQRKTCFFYLNWNWTWIKFHFFCLGFFLWGQGSHTHIVEGKEALWCEEILFEKYLLHLSLETFHRK